jgi:hypothetical protein
MKLQRVKNGSWSTSKAVQHHKKAHEESQTTKDSLVLEQGKHQKRKWVSHIGTVANNGAGEAKQQKLMGFVPSTGDSCKGAVAEWFVP